LPAVGLRDVESGAALDLSAWKGDVVVVNYWATWCSPCKKAMPLVEELQKRNAHRGLHVLGVSDEEPELLRKFIRNRPIEYERLAYDAERAFAGEVWLTSYPTFIVVGRDGTVKSVLTGAAGAKELEGVVKELL
jgi:thiol-disulfide isomerase/thioredoxin